MSSSTEWIKNCRLKMELNIQSTYLVSLVAIICVFGLLTLSESASPSRKPKNLAEAANRSCDKLIIDACATTLFVFGRRDVYLPQNFAEMVPHCQEEFDAEDCIKNFARKCLPPFERQVARLLILGAGQVLRKRCSLDGTREYLTHYKCIKQTLPQMHDAMDQLIYTLMTVSGGLQSIGNNNNNSSSSSSNSLLQDADLKIPISCCSFARFQQAALRIVKLGCGDYDPKADEYIGSKMIRGYTGDVLDLSCQGYELGSDKCAKLKLPSGGFEWHSNGTLIKQMNAKLPVGPKPNSVVLPFLDIFTNL